MKHGNGPPQHTVDPSNAQALPTSQTPLRITFSRLSRSLAAVETHYVFPPAVNLTACFGDARSRRVLRLFLGQASYALDLGVCEEIRCACMRRVGAWGKWKRRGRGVRAGQMNGMYWRGRTKRVMRSASSEG
jgi:hypothetical protein